MENKLLESALKYHDMGWSVIPLSAGAKVPPKGFSVIPYRNKLASKEEIEKWWSENPEYNIGIITGKFSNLFVIDIDTEEGKQNIAQYVPDSLITPTVETPRGGQHLFFKYPKDQNITIGAGKISGSDFRGEGGYVVAAPSVNGNGKSYSWVIKPDQELADLPVLYINKINSIIYEGVTEKQNDLLQSVTINLNKGTRNDSLFHIAHTMMKGGAKKEDVSFTLNLLAKQCNPPFIESEIVTICNSILERAARKERNLTKELEGYIAVTNGYFAVTDCYMALQVVTKEDKGAVRIALTRLKDKLIEKHGIKDGVYKRIEKEFEFINFDDDEKLEVEYPVKLPLGLNDIAEVSQGNIILVGGEFNAGKTTFLLNVLKDNKEWLPLRYITSEMSKSEFKKRFATFGLPLNFWKQSELTDYVKKSSDFHAAIRPDAINIVDYMEFKDSDYTKGAEYLTQIHDKLTTGIAIVAVQKKKNQRMPRSGDMIVEKPRLAIAFSTLSSSNENPEGVCEILKCKMPKLGKIDEKRCRFEIQNRGSKFHILNDWGYLRF